MKMKYKLLLLFFCLFFQTTYPQLLDRKIEIFTTIDGLPDNCINAIQKDSKGFIWIATNNGLTRFDGQNFVNFSTTTHAAFFKNNIVDDIIVDKNLIYLVSGKEGVKLFDTDHLTLNNFFSRGIRSFSVNGNRQILLDNYGKLEVYENRKKRNNRSFTSFEPHNFIHYNNHYYLLTQGQGVLKISEKTLQTRNIIPADSVYMRAKLLHSKSYGLVYASGDRVYILDRDKFIPHPNLKSIIGITNYFENQNSQPFYISRSKNIYGYTIDKFVNEKISITNNLEIKKLFFVTPTCYLIATNQGLIRVSDSKKISQHIDDNLLLKNEMIRIRRKIIPLNSEVFYLLGHPQIVVSKKGVLKNIPSNNFSIYDAVYLNHKIYCTTDSYGIISFDVETNKSEKIKLDSIPFKEFFYVIEKCGTHEVILGATDKIVIHNTFKNKTKIIKTPGLTIYSITKEGNTIWIGTNKGLRCAHYFNGVFSWKKIPSLYKKTIRNIAIDHIQNKIWLGTEEDGLLIVNPINFSYQTKKNSILKNIATITPDKDGNMWVSTFNGIMIFDIKNKTQYKLTKANGLINQEFNYKSAALIGNSKMIFGGLNGYDLIDFKNIKKDLGKVNTIEITGIKTITSSNIELERFENFNNQKELSFKTGEEEINLTVSNLDKTGISNSNFSYKINNAKSINPNNNIIRISNLPYGKHKLTIFLYDNFGNLKDQKVIIINAKVPFYYEINFYIFLALLILISGIGIIYYIIKSRKIETKIKDQIAMDLHDEVGTVLTRMLFISKSNKKLELQHDEIKKGIIEALFSIRTSITALSNTNTTLENLIYDTKELLHKELSNTSIEFLINEEKGFSSINLKPELYRDCKLIIFEATTNMIKYSNATSFFIHFDLDCQFTITITDNGHLKNINSIYNKGNGIANIIKRTERNKGTYSFSIVPPHGLSIQLKFNIK